MSFVGDILEGVGDVIGDVAEFAVEDVLPIASTVASFVPGPWQAPALAFRGAQSLAGGNPIGAALSFAGAGGWSPFGGGSDFGGFDPGGALYGQTGAAPWSVNPGSGMNWWDGILEETGNFTGGGMNWWDGILEETGNFTGGEVGGDPFGGFGDSGGWGYPDLPPGAEQWPAPVEERILREPGLLDRINRALGTNIGTSDVQRGLSAGQTIARIFGWGGTAGSFMDMLGRAAPGLLGAYGSRQQGSVLQGIADRARGDRAPFLAKANEWLAGGPEAYGAGPGAGALRGTLAALSASGGNPIGSGSALSIASQAGLQDWRSGVTGMANLGLGGEDTRANLNLAAASAGNIWPGLGRAAGDVFGGQQSSLEELLRRLGGGNDIFTRAG